MGGADVDELRDKLAPAGGQDDKDREDLIIKVGVKIKDVRVVQKDVVKDKGKQVVLKPASQVTAEEKLNDLRARRFAVTSRRKATNHLGKEGNTVSIKADGGDLTDNSGQQVQDTGNAKEGWQKTGSWGNGLVRHQGDEEGRLRERPRAKIARLEAHVKNNGGRPDTKKDIRGRENDEVV